MPTTNNPPTPTLDTQPPDLRASLATQEKQYTDCTSCKLMGSAAFTGLGLYSYWSGRRALREREAEILRSGSRFGLGVRKLGLVGVSGVLVAVGAWRLVD